MHFDISEFSIMGLAVAAECRKKLISGFFLVADLNTGSAFFALINRDSALRLGVEGKRDANFAAIAGAKFGKVLAHMQHSEGETTIFGEHAYKGGRLSANKRFIYVFSGATADEDDELVQLAERVHTSKG